MKITTDNLLQIACNYVMYAKFRKSAPDAFKAVEDAGYTIKKYDGRFVIGNPKTCRYISIMPGRIVDKLKLDSGYNTQYIRIDGGSKEKNKAQIMLYLVDYINFLETPSRNYAFIKRQREEAMIKSKAREKYAKIKDAEWSVNYEKMRIEEIQAKINQLQQELIYHAGEKARCEIELKKTRKNYGLKV